ncbi:MAG: trypsin-like peptidase domain-containing protein [Deltaproteobacteria bacterium]|nr:trypsin-like peptidase domain-containing protein [Deltaproteobacteria bacterium]
MAIQRIQIVMVVYDFVGLTGIGFSRQAPDIGEYKILRLFIFMICIALYSHWAWAAQVKTGQSLALLEDQQNVAIAKVRFAAVNVTAFNRGKPGMQNVGAGVVVTCKGHILTNSHVVHGFDTIEVGMLEGRGVKQYNAKIMQDDPAGDLALLTTDKQGECISAAFADQKVNVGDRILVIGAPFGYGHSVTSGIVSKGHRDIVLDNISYKDMIQTDASINQGNSGGPMINLSGEIVGITTAIFSRTQSTNGLGFAIPAKRAVDFIKAAIKTPGFGSLVAVKKDMETINLTEKPPHKFLGNCLDCHKIAYKTPITPGEPQPHPFMGACTQCHDIVKDRPGKVVTVSASSGYLGKELKKMEQTAAQGISQKSASVYLRYILFLTLLMIVCFVVYKVVTSYSGGASKK